jgi:hypothetical protein
MVEFFLFLFTLNVGVVTGFFLCSLLAVAQD